MKIIFSLMTALVLLIGSCKQKQTSTNSKILATPFIDSFIKKSDSNYERKYYRTDFVTAQYYINKKDSIICQLMKDSAGLIRQVIITNKNRRIFFGSYYANGQLQADLPLDSFGQYHGTGKFYYEDGGLQSSGTYTHGFKTGSWKVYDAKGKETNTDNFDENGNIIPQKLFNP